MLSEELNLREIIDNYTLPTLHPDLQPYLFEYELQHPLVNLEGGVYPRLYRRINKLYAFNTRQANQPRNSNAWQKFLPDLESHDRITQFTLQELDTVALKRETPQFFEMLGQIWTDLECLCMTSSFLELMLGIFDHRPISPLAHYIMTLAEKAKLADLPEEFLVFRGHAHPLLNGMSWTINRDIAIEYALGSPLKSSLSVGIVSQSDVIAFIDRWDEDEVIIHSSSVKNIQTLDLDGTCRWDPAQPLQTPWLYVRDRE